MTFRVEVEQEEDSRWLAEVIELPGVLTYGSTQEDAVAKVQALALRVVAERLEHGEAGSDLLEISFKAA
ncbi:MAG TPA: type II toxin-antitoxin system HicB family antitoxin [Thermoanaerobaculia bacterium]|nr:type II toxin-antitoxin system HicB family antitoxin [Thermoanaerobaculia bacterium]